MTSKVLELDNVITPDQMAVQITEKYLEWQMSRQRKLQDWEEVRRYIYATDTTQTSNNQLPWKNKTTIPKLCQIRDNLYANYTATLFPQRKWLIWEANEQDSNSTRKRDAITNYINWCISQPMFKHEMDKIILDYIEYGNCIATVEWVDQRVQKEDNSTQAGFVGPMPKRISPLDAVFNPTAENFEAAPKIFKSIVSLGELKEILERMSNDENREEYEALWTYLKDIRRNAHEYDGDWAQRDNLYQIDGFSNFRDYLCSDVAEVLTFYGDLYDPEEDKFYKNHVITVVDRHKLIGKKPNPSFFGYPPIFHAPWRKKQDNLWGMGPLDNLVGMQYRLDHIENMRADIVDLVTYPVIKVKGFVEDFTWQPGEHIYASEEGDVEMMAPDVQVLQLTQDLQMYPAMMEEAAGSPREAMGFRSPGEKTKYEVQRLENAWSRLYQNKIKQFEEQIVEKVLNAMLELAKRNLTGVSAISIFDNELKITSFQDLTVEDITGVGRIKPVAARHFAEQAELVQNLTSLTQSNLWPAVMPHFSSVKIAKILEHIFNLEDFEVVTPYIALAEQAEGQKLLQSLQEQTLMEMGTASGIGMDYDIDQDGQPLNIPENAMQPIPEELPASQGPVG